MYNKTNDSEEQRPQGKTTNKKTRKYDDNHKSKITNVGQVHKKDFYINKLGLNFFASSNFRPNDALQTQPWKQKEFALLDPDNNLLTFGQSGN